MLRVVIVALLLVAGTTGCGKMRLRVSESQGCSVSNGDDPFRFCTPQYDLVCIATYTVGVTDPKKAMRYDGGAVDVYICRRPCFPDASTSICLADEVCCPGRIHGKDYGAPAGCTPATLCDNRPRGMTDGPVRPPPLDAGVDGASDATADARAPSGDAPGPSGDAPVVTDVPAADDGG